jgi:hypothetical protein
MGKRSPSLLRVEEWELPRTRESTAVQCRRHRVVRWLLPGLVLLFLLVVVDVVVVLLLLVVVVVVVEHGR